MALYILMHDLMTIKQRIFPKTFFLPWPEVRQDLKKIGPTPASFLFIFGLFKQTIQFLQQINVKKCPSSIRRWDSNPRPLERESTPITTRPGLPPTARSYRLTLYDLTDLGLIKWLA